MLKTVEHFFFKQKVVLVKNAQVFFVTQAPHPVLKTDSGKHHLTPISSNNRYTLSSVFMENFAVEGEKSISRINFKTTSPMLKIQCSSPDRHKKYRPALYPDSL